MVTPVPAVDLERWKKRFNDFHRAFHLLKSPLEEGTLNDFSMLEKEGLIHRFEYCLELTWTVMTEYMEFDGVVLEQATPRQVIKRASAARIIADEPTWSDMLDWCDQLSNTYDQRLFERALEIVKARFLPALIQAYEVLLTRDLEGRCPA